MDHDFSLIFTFVGGLTAALLFGLIARKLHLSPLVGYLLAGVVVGPYSPGFVADSHTVEQFAELGVILLMFGVGLHFHLKDLIAVQRVAVPGAVVQISVATVLGVLVGWMFGWSTISGLVFGMAISVASTVVLTRVLEDNQNLHTPSGHVALGWLVVEDLFTILLLVLIPAVMEARQSGAGDWSGILYELGWMFVKLSLLVALTLFAGKKIIPLVLRYVARTGARDLFTLAVLVGFGPTGRILKRILNDNGVEVIIVEMNIDTVTAIREQGGDIVYGDASQREILRHAGIEYAESLILSASIPDAKEIVGVALELNPHIDVMIHTKYMRDVDVLKEAGASQVFSSESEVALSMAEYFLREGGADDEQIVSERQRIRAELDREVPGASAAGH